MKPTLKYLLKINRLPMGRRHSAFIKIRLIALALGLTDVVEFCDIIIAFEEELREKTLTSKKIVPNSQLSFFGTLISKTLTAIQKLCLLPIENFPDSEEAKLGQEVINDIFSGGVAGITQQVRPDIARDMDIVLKKFKTLYSGHAEALNFEKYVEKLDGHCVDFITEFDKVKKKEVTAEELREGKNTGQNHMRSLVARIIGTYPDETPEHISARKRLLDPLFNQLKEVKAYRKSRRKVLDINPETGEVEVEGETPASPEATKPESDKPSET